MNLGDTLKQIQSLLALSILTLVLLVFTIALYDSGFRFPHENDQEIKQQEVVDPDLIENGIHVRTGLIDGEGLQVVIASCTACHSAKLVTQNRATREGWISTIRWMQATQNLWELGESEEVIVKYLTENYAPTKKGRRANLTEIEWYDLEE